MLLLLFFLFAPTLGWPACYLSAVPTYTYDSQRLLVSYSIFDGGIGGQTITGALLVPAFEDSSVSIVLPETWPDDLYDANTSSIEAFAGCESRRLTGVVRSSQETRVIISFDGLLQLLGGSFAWSLGTKRLMPGTHSWQQYLVRREGTSGASNCAPLTCTFEGQLDGREVLVHLNPGVAGIGVASLPTNECVELLIHGSQKIRVEACRTRKVCRDNLCVQQLYQHDGEPNSVVVGFDLLEEKPRDLLVYMNPTETRLGFLYSSNWVWTTRPTLLITTIVLFLAGAVFITRPLAAQLDSRTHQQRVVMLNMAATVVIVAITLFELKGALDRVARSSDMNLPISVVLMVTVIGSMLINFALVVYANLWLSPTSLQRNFIIRVAFPSMLCIVFIFVHCGATERDWQSFFPAVAAGFWLYHIPRMLANTYVMFGEVWLVDYGVVLFVAQFPFVVLVGLETALGVFSIIDIPRAAPPFLFAIYIILGGIFVGMEEAETGRKKEKI